MTGAPIVAPAAALVTGASSGIGREIARLFAADGHEVVLVARREDALRQLAAELSGSHGPRAHVHAADLAEAGAAAAVAERVAAWGLPVGHLVNAAGFAAHGPFVETGPDRQRDMIRVNVEALTGLTRAFLPGMVGRGRGRILNVASTAGFMPGPRMAVYYATKAYVLHFSIALALELERTGVTVTALCPGPTRTAFAAEAGMTGTRLFARNRGMDPGRVARAGYRGMAEGRRVVVPGLVNKAITVATRAVPRSFAARVAGALQAPAES